MTKIVSVTVEENQVTSPTWKIELPTQYKCQLYPRVSTKAQIENVSSEMQQDKSFALSCGWVEEGIIIDTRDLGKSGQLRMEDRDAFRDMLYRIINGIIKAVVVVNVDRLFRRRWFDEAEKFMEICHKFGVLVVTPDFVYDFRIDWHVDRFRRRIEEAADYIKLHIEGRMLPAKHRNGREGMWVGGSMTAGYMVDTRKKIGNKRNLNYGKPFPYMPHIEKVRWLHERYKAHRGNVNRVFMEVVKLPYLFPAIDKSLVGLEEGEYAYKVNYKEVYDEKGVFLGWTLASDKSVKQILTNVMYIGYAVYQGVLVDDENHTPTIDLDTFMTAYNFLSPTLLDGSPNPVYLERIGRQVKQYRSDYQGLLINHLVSGIDGYYVTKRELPKVGDHSIVKCAYSFLPKQKIYDNDGCVGMVASEDVDSYFFMAAKQKFQEKMATATEFQGYLTHEKAELEEQGNLEKSIAEQIEATKNIMTNIKKNIASGKITDEDLLDEANTSYTMHKEELSRLEAQQKNTGGMRVKATQRYTYTVLIGKVLHLWNNLYPPMVEHDELPDFIDGFLSKAVLIPLSPQFYRVDFYWNDPDWGVDSYFCYRGGNPSHTWKQEEDDFLREHYSHGTRGELMQGLPTRTFDSIMRRSTRTLGLKRQVRDGKGGLVLSAKDYEIFGEYGIAEEEIVSVKVIKLDNDIYCCGRCGARL